MSLTQAENVYIGAHEDALNALVEAVCTDRPRLLVYGSPAFVPATTVQETSMAAIPFPGVAGGIEWRVRLSRPVIDLHPQSVALPPELALAQGGLSIRLGVEICLDCRRLRIDPRPPRPNDDDTKPVTHPLREATCCKIEVFAVGGLQRVAAAGGQDAITFRIDGVEIVDVAPEEVERLLECLLFMILQAVLATIRIPLTALRAGAFTLALTVGPAIEDDQVKARGI